MDSDQDFNRFRYRTRVQAVAVIDILVGTIPFIIIPFNFNDKHLADEYKDRHYLVLLWSVLLCVYVLQLIMGIWLLAATREVSAYSHFVYSEYTVGNCQVWYHVALFTFVFYIGELAYEISTIINTPSKSIKEVMLDLSFHAAKIIYRAFTLMIVNNFLYDVCRPVSRYLSQGSYQYKYYYQSRLGIRLPSRSAYITAPTATAVPIQQINPTYNYYSTYPQPRSKLANPNLLNPNAYPYQNFNSNFSNANAISVQ